MVRGTPRKGTPQNKEGEPEAQGARAAWRALLGLRKQGVREAGRSALKCRSRLSVPLSQEQFPVRGALQVERSGREAVEQQPQQPERQRVAEPQQISLSSQRETAEACGFPCRRGETEKVSAPPPCASDRPVPHNSSHSDAGNGQPALREVSRSSPPCFGAHAEGSPLVPGQAWEWITASP